MPPLSATSYQLQSPTPRSQPSTTKYSALPTPIGNLLRAWLVLRWRLSRSVFAVPLPLLTSNFDVKLGDLILTLPLSVALIAVTALGAKDRDVAGTGSLQPSPCCWSSPSLYATTRCC